MAGHIILLGDSIFDNASYVVDQSCVTEQLRELVPEGTSVSMLAVDGDYISDVKTQVKNVPEMATHLFVSVGGNDALGHYRTLTMDYQNSGDLFEKWTDIQTGFRAEYRDMLGHVTAVDKPTAVCTIYDAIPGLERIAVTALSLFNDVIISEATIAGLPVVDLRRVCTEAEDYSHLSPIEPSHKGGEKIAKALHRAFEHHDFSLSATMIYS